MHPENLVTHWQREIISDPDDPDTLMIELGDEIMAAVGWKAGDEIEFVDNKDGSWTLKKVS